MTDREDGSGSAALRPISESTMSAEPSVLPADATEPPREPARLQALARIAAAFGGSLDDVLLAVAEAIQTAFRFNAVMNVHDWERDRYEVRAAAGGLGQQLLGSSFPGDAFDPLLVSPFEVAPDVFFISHDARPELRDLEIVVTPEFRWAGPGSWHAADMCLIRMRTSKGAELGLISVDSPVEQALPDAETFEMLRLLAMVGANAVENVMLTRTVNELGIEHEMQALRQELQDEVALRRSLLDIGTRLGAASSASSADIFDLLGERLDAVVPVKALTIYAADPSEQLCHPVYHSVPGDPDWDALLAYSVPFGIGATGTAALTQRTVISNVGQHERVIVEVPDSTDVDEHLMAVPVLVEEQTKAVLTMRRPADLPPFLPDDAHRAGLFAQHVASVFLLNELGESRRLLADQVEKLQELNRLKDEFVANVSHELRTPMTTIIGNVMTVAGLGDELGADERGELLTAAERQAKRLAEQLENLLAESRLTGEDPAIVPVAVDVGAFVEEVADSLRHRARDRTIDVHADGPGTVMTDRTLLYRILFNLGDNALKYSDGPVRFAVRREDGGDVRIDVSDEGIGIAAQDIPRIFEQFEQLDGSSSRRVGGVGLGLHLGQRAAGALGGRIEVRSEPGEGSTFSLWLPPECPRPAPSDR